MKKFLKKIFVLMTICISIPSNNFIFAESNEESYLKEDKAITESLVTNMIYAPHTGKGAIDMAKNLLNNGGENEEVVQIAKDIIKNQTISIASMESLMKTLIENLTQDKVREEKYLKEYEKIVKEMMCGLENLKPTGNVDKDFLQSMIVHHQGAIDMVNSIIKYTDNAEIKKMAEGELQNQQPEIDNMKKLFDSIK